MQKLVVSAASPARLAQSGKTGAALSRLTFTLLVLLLLLAGQFAGGFGLHTAHSAPAMVSHTYIVNSPGDDVDNNIGDGDCSDINGRCSLRAAIEEANFTTDADIIQFNIPGGGLKTITPATALPAITQPVTIDGTSQPGAGCPGTLAVQLSGGGANYPGLLLQGGASVVRGLVINGFSGAPAGAGIEIDSSTNTIQCNFIGTDAAGTGAAGNYLGVFINTGAENLIGSDGDGTNDSAEGNVIAFNGKNGITLTDSAGTSNRISQNSIFENTGLGIDLNNDGVTVNDIDDADAGPNNLQNFANINDVRRLNGTTEVDATMTAVANTQFTVEFFYNTACDSSDHGEGQTFLGSQQVTSDGDGNLIIYAVLPTAAPVDSVITATATDPDGNTSEFSNCFTVPNTLSINNVTQAEGNAGLTDFNFTVSLDVTATTAISVDYATQDNSATNPDDYLPTNGTLNFAPGDKTKTITVQVVGDLGVEPDEAFLVSLFNQSGANVSKSIGIGTIVNDDTPPGVSVSDVSQLEGNGGPTNFVFDVTLDKPYPYPISVHYATANGSAEAGSDYTAAAGVVDFAPNQTSQQVVVVVNGDTRAEGNETFFVNLSDPVGTAIIKGQGIGTILNDDAAPGQPADLIAKLRLTPDREFGLASGGQISYTLTVKNIGPGQAEQVAARFPLNPQLELVFAQAANPAVWVEKIVTDTETPYVQVRFPNLQDSDELSIDLVFKAAAGAATGPVVSRFSANWDDSTGAGKSVLSNSETVGLVTGSASLDVSGGAIQVLAVEDLGGGKLRLTGDFYAPNEIVSWWYTDANSQSVALGNSPADSTGKASFEVNLAGLSTGQTYSFAGFGNRTEVTGGIAVTIVEGQALKVQEPNTSEIKLLKTQAAHRSL